MILLAAVLGAATRVRSQWKYDVTLTGYPGARWKALTSYVDKPALGDVTGDGIPEIIGVSVFGDVWCVDGLTGQILWTYEDDRSYELAIYICPALADLDCDGAPDIVSVTPAGNIIALAGRNGRKMWNHRTAGRTAASPTAYDVDRDGLPELFVTDTAGNIYCLSNSGKEIWKARAESPLYGSPAVGPVGGRTVVLSGDHQGRLYAWDAQTGVFSWVAGPKGAESCTSPILFHDGGTTAKWRVLAGYADGTVVVYDAASGATIWERRYSREAVSDFSLADLKPDGHLDFVFSTAGRRVLAASTRDGKELWRRTIRAPVREFRDPAAGRRIEREVLAGQPLLADLDGDGGVDVVVEIRGLNNFVSALSGSDGKVLWQYGNRDLYRNPALTESVVISTHQELSPLTVRTSTVPSFSQPTPVLADFDGDGRPELIVNDRDEVGLISVPMPAASGRSPWPKYMASPCNNIGGGSLPCVAEAKPPSLQITVEPVQITAGEPAQLCWESTRATAVRIGELRELSLSGCREVRPSHDTTWTGIAVGCGEAVASTILRVLPKPPPPPAPPPAPPTLAGEPVVLEDVFFEYDWYRLTAGAVRSLDENARRLRNRPELRLVLEASCDERGAPVYNRFLSIARGETVRDYLVSQGIDASRLEIRAIGETTKWDPELDERGWALNRRVHFEVLR